MKRDNSKTNKQRRWKDKRKKRTSNLKKNHKRI